MDKYSVGTPTFSQTGPSLGSRERLHPLCLQCGRKYHYDRVPGDQCRLMTALLGQGWGSKYQYDTAKNTSPIPHVERKVRPETAEEEQWLAELDLFTAAAITVNHFDKHAAEGCCPHIYVQ